jgi:hypothetical protein
MQTELEGDYSQPTNAVLKNYFILPHHINFPCVVLITGVTYILFRTNIIVVDL